MKNKILTAVLLTVFVVGMAFGQTNGINELFTDGIPSGWLNSDWTTSTTGNGDAASISASSINSSIVTSAVVDPTNISFDYYSADASSGLEIAYDTSQTGTFTTLSTVTSNKNTWSQYTQSLTLTGTYYFKFTLTSRNKSIIVDNLVITVSPSMNVSTSSLSGFLYEPSSGPSSEQTFTVSGQDLTTNISVNAPTNYEVSTSSGSGFGSSVSLTQSDGTVASTTIYVILKSGLSAGTYNENITISTTGSSNKTVTCSGDVRESIAASTSSLSGFLYEPSSGPSSEQSFTVSGADLTNNISIAPPTNYEISTGTGVGFSATNPITLTQSGGTVNSTTIYVRLKAGLSQGTYNSEDITISSTGKISKTVTCSGFIGPLILNIKVFVEGALW